MITRRDVLKAIAASGLSIPIAHAYEVDVPEGGLVVIQSDEPIKPEDFSRLKATLAKMTGRDFVLVAMPLKASLESISEKEMNRAGWYRRR
jgi:hypothetical protein